MLRLVGVGAGVGVVAPGATDVAAALDDQEVAVARLVELDRRAEAGETGPDHEGVHVGGQVDGEVGWCGRPRHGTNLPTVLNERQ